MTGLILWGTPFVLFVLAGGIMLWFDERERHNVWGRS